MSRKTITIISVIFTVLMLMMGLLQPFMNIIQQ